MPKHITKIVITGGPCAGKTTGMGWIKKAFTAMGYSVIFIPETATELISGGVAPWTLNSVFDYQLCQMKLQIHKEQIFEEAAEKLLDADKVIIVCDRGLIDNKAYMSGEDYNKAFGQLDLYEQDVLNRYDAVFHLESAAKGAEEFYTLRGNAARTETAEEASAIDDRLIAAWKNHPHFRVIESKKGIKDKMKQLVSEIASFLGEHFEIERKFLIEYPDIAYLDSNPDCRKIKIVQTYLTSNGGEERRVRCIEEDGKIFYIKTVKQKIDNIKRLEKETEIPEEEYLRLLEDADKSKKPINKTRYCLTYKNKCFEIDVYPFWQDKAIAEIELSDETEEFVFPDCIKVIKEVTGDDKYKNTTLAKR